DSTASARHEVHRVEPQLQRRGRPLEDRSAHRMDAVAARSAEPARALLRRFVTLKDPLRIAAGTVGMLAVRGEALTPQPHKAGLVIGELPRELQKGASRFGRGGADRVSAVNWGHVSLLVGKKAVRALTRAAFALSKPNSRDRVRRSLSLKGIVPP